MQPAQTASRPTLWPLLAAYVAAFVLAMGASVAFVLAAVAGRAGGSATRLADEAMRFALTAPGLLGAAFVDAAVLVGVTLVAARLMGGGAQVRLRLGPTRATPLGVVATVVGMAGLSLASGAAADLLTVGHGGVMEAIASALRSSDPARVLVALLAIAVAPAIAEEGFFRGLLLTRLTARWGRWPAIVTSAAAFGLFHLDPVQGSLAFVAGIFLGWASERFSGIRPTMVAHGVNNAMFVLFACLASSDEHGTRTEAAVTGIGGAVACAACVALLRSRVAVRATASISAS